VCCVRSRKTDKDSLNLSVFWLETISTTLFITTRGSKFWDLKNLENNKIKALELSRYAYVSQLINTS
jgi:hypothetical protein